MRTMVAIALIAGAGLACLASGRQDPKNTECMSNVRQLCTGVLMYCQDYDERMPPTKSVAKFKSVIMPYIKNQKIFKCPVTGADYQPAAALHQKKQKEIKQPANTPMILDAKAHPDGLQSIGYADGHVRQKKAGK